MLFRPRPSSSIEENKRVPDASQICGIIDSQEDVGGWPELKSAPAPFDTDGDGMPDEWESKYGLDAQTADNNRLNADGYTALEVYINSMAGETMNTDFAGASVEAPTTDVKSLTATWCQETALLSLSSGDAETTVSVISLTGALVYQTVYDGTPVDLSFLPHGAYLVKLEKTGCASMTLPIIR